MNNIDRAENTKQDASSSLKVLLHNVNISSSSARIGWISFITFSAILFVMLSSIKDVNLLLKTPVIIPLINLAVPMKTFFLAMPALYIFAHFSILLQNVLLAQKVEIFDTNVSNLEELNKVGVHPIRFQLNSYFMTQVIAGPTRHKSIGRYLDDISWISLTVIPQLILIYFLLTYLPNHDTFSTWVHRFYILLDILVILTISTYFTAPLLSFAGALWDTVKYYPFRTLFSSILVGFGLFFSFAIATIPGEMIERRLAMFNIFAPDFVVQKSPDSFFLTSLIFGDKNATQEEQRIGLFRRNLYIIDRNINELQQAQNGETRVNLRNRDLRYATFNRSNINSADFSRAKLNGASFLKAALQEGQFTHSHLNGTRFINSKLDSSNFHLANAFGANFSQSSLYNTNFTKANIIASNFSNTQMAGTTFNDAKLHGSHFYKSDLRSATFINSWLVGVSFSDANLLAADLSQGILWESVPPSSADFIDFSNRKLSAPTDKERRWVLAGLNTIQDRYLQQKVISVLSPVLNKKSASQWPRSLDYDQWKTVLRQNKAVATPSFKSALSEKLSHLSCSEASSKAYLTTAIVKRITATYLQQPIYNGNAEQYIKKVLAQPCPAFHKIPTAERQKIIDIVLKGRSITDFMPKKPRQPSIRQAEPSMVTPAATDSSTLIEDRVSEPIQ